MKINRHRKTLRKESEKLNNGKRMSVGQNENSQNWRLAKIGVSY
jgi:hypothetical protein